MNEAYDWTVEAVLLHSNDIHSRLENAARMATFIAEERRKYGSDRVLAVDIGDHMDRMRVETEGTDGLVNIELLNAACYDAATLGNNEGLTFIPEALEAAYRDRARFALLVANMRRMIDGERPSWMSPSAVIRKGNISIGLIGVTAKFSDFYSLLGWDVTDPIEAVMQEAALLRPNADVLVVMSHLGLPLDQRMAEEVEGIDLILGGHTHHLLEEPLIINGTTICAAGKFGDRIGRVEIGRNERSGAPLFRVACVPVAAYEEHWEAAAIIERNRAVAEKRLERVVASLDTPLPARPDQESPLTNLMAAGLRRWTNAEIGIVNNGQLLAGLAIGNVTAGELHAICPSPINPCRMKLAGLHIRTALEQSLQSEFVHKEIKGFGFRGHVLGTLAVDGVSIEAEHTASGELAITAIAVGGELLDDEREYVVGTIDMFTFGVGYLSLKQGSDIAYYLPEFIRDLLAEQLSCGELIAAALQQRLVIRGRATT